MNGPWKTVLVRYQKSYREKKKLSFKEYLSGCELDVGRNMNCKCHSYEISDRNEEMLMEIGGR